MRESIFAETRSFVHGPIVGKTEMRFDFQIFVYIFQLFVYDLSKKTTASQTHFGFTNIGS